MMKYISIFVLILITQFAFGQIEITATLEYPTCINEDFEPTNNGSIDIEITGGVPPYEISWSNGSMTEDITELFPNYYTVSVTDNAGELVWEEFFLSNDNDEPYFFDLYSIDPDCHPLNGEPNGEINIETFGGLPPYIYNWEGDGIIQGESNQINLGGELYSVTVIDGRGCHLDQIVGLIVPNPIEIEAAIENLDCQINGTEFGSISLNVSQTFSETYSWSHDPSLNESFADNLPPGEYHVTVSDPSNCTETATYNITGSPPIIIDASVTNVECTDMGELSLGSIELTTSGGIPPFEYFWSDNTDDMLAQNQENLEAGIYSVTVVDSEGCASTPLEVEITSAGSDLQSPYLCLITNDNIDGYFEIYWEGPDENDGITKYNIYREGSAANQFDLIGTVDVENDNKFIDETAISAQQAYRYYISSANDCGNESAPSEIHKTIHLTINQGAQNNINLIWDEYDGITYDQITIFRGDSPSTLLEYVVLPGNIFSFSDNNILPGDSYYQIVITAAIECDITKELFLLKSNVSSFDVNSIHTVSWIENIYPNPFNQNINLTLERDASIQILNSNGRIIQKLELKSGTNSISTTTFPSGIFIMKLNSGNETGIWRGIKN